MRNECNQYNKATFDFIGDARSLVLAMNAGLSHINKEPLEATLMPSIREFGVLSEENDSGTFMNDWELSR